MLVRPRIFWVHDYETIVNCFVGCFLNFKTREMRTFVVHFLRSDWTEFLDFLEENQSNKDWHFGYNNLGFDSQITEYILANLARFRLLTDPDVIARHLQEYAGYVIQKTREKEFLDFPEFKMTIRQHDIFKQNHWDNAAKQSSLKWVQFSMDWPNVEEMPHDYRQPVMDQATLDMVISYCHNDVLSTAAIYDHKNDKGQRHMMEAMTLRRELSEMYQVNLMSASETRITKEIFLFYLMKAMNLPKQVLRKMRTERQNVALKEIMVPIEFNTPDFKAVQIWFEQLVIDTSHGTDSAEKSAKGPKLDIWIKDVKTTYALGGIHGCIKPGIYRSEKGKILMSADVTSFYPMLAIKNKWHPQHIPQHIFTPTYQGFFDERLKYPKSHFLNKLFKLVLNGTYGQTKDKYSFLYDPRFTFQITINGQLWLSKLYEMLLEGIPGLQPIMQNTDGLEVLIDEQYKDKYYQICAEWEKMTQLSLEYVEYDKMIIRDVNNYIATWTENGKLKTKAKGAFEYEDLPLHKNKSMLVIPKALFQYFVHGVKPEDYLKTNQNFFDYCAGAKLRGDFYFEEVGIKDGVEFRHKHKKLLRYYISKDGNKLVKRDGPGVRQIQLEADKRWKQVTCNQYVEKPFNEYNIDLRYYLEAIRDEIKKIESHAECVILNTKAAQMSLF